MSNQDAPEPGGFGLILVLRDLSEAVEGAPLGNRVWVKSIVPGSPAHRSNPALAPGDELVRVIDHRGNKHYIKELLTRTESIEAVATIMAGAAGTQATLTFHDYGGTRGEFSVALTRRAISLTLPSSVVSFSPAEALASLVRYGILAFALLLTLPRLPQLTALLPTSPPLKQAVYTGLQHADSAGVSVGIALGIPALILSFSQPRSVARSNGLWQLLVASILLVITGCGLAGMMHLLDTTTLPPRPLGTPLRGQVALVTGGPAGLGFESARALQELGATVVLACNPWARGGVGECERAVAKRAREYALREGFFPIQVRSLDLESTESVGNFAPEFRLAFSRLDILLLAPQARGTTCHTQGSSCAAHPEGTGAWAAGSTALVRSLADRLVTGADEGGPNARVVVVVGPAQWAGGLFGARGGGAVGGWLARMGWAAAGARERVEWARSLPGKVKEVWAAGVEPRVGVSAVGVGFVDDGVDGGGEGGEGSLWSLAVRSARCAARVAVHPALVSSREVGSETRFFDAQGRHV